MMSKIQSMLADLEIRIFERREPGYPVELTLDGQQEFKRGYLAADILPWVSSGDLVTDGQKLFAQLLADPDLHMAWAEARGRAPLRSLRLRIDPTASELHIIPWELLQEDHVMLSAQSATPFSRYLPIALPWGGAVSELPIRILVVISSPDDLKTYNLANIDFPLERQALEEVFKGLADVQVDFLDPPATIEKIETSLRKGYHILHFLGHGMFNKRAKRLHYSFKTMRGIRSPCWIKT